MAALQHWRCPRCDNLLNPPFEVITLMHPPANSPYENRGVQCKTC